MIERLCDALQWPGHALSKEGLGLDWLIDEDLSVLAVEPSGATRWLFNLHDRCPALHGELGQAVQRWLNICEACGTNVATPARSAAEDEPCLCEDCSAG